MSVKVTSALRDEAREYLDLCDQACALGIPVACDDPRSPKTVQELRDLVNIALDELPDPEASWALRNQTR